MRSAYLIAHRPSIVIALVFAAFFLSQATAAGRDQSIVAADVSVVTGLRWRLSHITGLSNQELAFAPVYARLGVTASMAGAASARLSLSSAGDAPSVRDACLAFVPSRSLCLTVGQFLCPLGRESTAEPESLIASDYSLLARFWKPYDARDVGVRCDFTADRVVAAIAVVNGDGRNRPLDSNLSKDICARVEIQPFSALALDLGVSAYYGHPRIGTDDLPFVRVSVDFDFVSRAIGASAEAQYAKVPGGDKRLYVRNSAFLQLVWLQAPHVEPVLRVQAETQHEDRYEAGLDLGCRLPLLAGRASVGLSYTYWRKESRLYPVLSGDSHAIGVKASGGI